MSEVAIVAPGASWSVLEMRLFKIANNGSLVRFSTERRRGAGTAPGLEDKKFHAARATIKRGGSWCQACRTWSRAKFYMLGTGGPLRSLAARRACPHTFVP